MKVLENIVPIAFAVIVAVSVVSCAEKGKSGTEGIDCGDFGAAHDGHCHCNEGYFYDGATCVAPEDITRVCGDEVSDAGEADTSSEAATAESDHSACVCPTDGDCPCTGEISTFGGKDYCSPALHEE